MIQLTRLPGYDVNGNPRYVCHYVNLLTDKENRCYSAMYGTATTSRGYEIAIQRAHKIGGRKYHTKAYGGGIVFTDYESNIRYNIERIVKEAENDGI